MPVRVEPQVYMVASMYLADIEAYLQAIGSPAWKPDDNISDAENLIAAGGKMCYRSWEPFNEDKPDATNPNVSRVRSDSTEYIGNILKSGHGSVVEHASVSFIFKDVSRVFTHELVRHRAGTAFSQESLRFVRLSQGLKYFLPSVIAAKPEAVTLFQKAMFQMESWQLELEAMFAEELDPKSSFHQKKELTSAFRRIAPDGLATTIMMTANMRSLRHMIAMRTALGAEEEIRIAFNEVAKICKDNFPLVFQDMSCSQDSIPVWTFDNKKI